MKVATASCAKADRRAPSFHQRSLTIDIFLAARFDMSQPRLYLNAIGSTATGYVILNKELEAYLATKYPEPQYGKIDFNVYVSALNR